MTKASRSGTRAAKSLLRKTRRFPLKTAVLRTLYASSVLGIALVVPQALTVLRHFDRAKARRREVRYRIIDTIRKLQRKGLIAGTENDPKSLRLTAKGEREIERVLLSEYHITEPVRWDGKWRIVMFDIREKRRLIRQKLRILLIGAGMVRLQDSVWVYPYPCDEFVQLIRAHLASGVGELLYLTADGIESDRALRIHFNLQ